MKALIGVCLLLWACCALGNDGLITAQGMGTVDKTLFPNETQAKMMAKRAAQIDAMRLLTEAVRGVRLSGGTTVEEMEVTSDVIAVRVKGLLRGAFEIDSLVEAEGGSIVASVTLGLCLERKSTLCKSRPLITDIVETTDEP